MPTIKIQPLDNIKFTDYEVKITEEETKKRINDIAANQNNFSERTENESSQNGDLIAFDYKATVEDKRSSEWSE